MDLGCFVWPAILVSIFVAYILLRGMSQERTEVEDDDESRDWVVEIFQTPPPDATLVADNSNVAGVSYRKKDVAAFTRGSGQQLVLERDPDNPHSRDGSAIRVIGHWVQGGKRKSAHLGFVPTEYSHEIAGEHPKDAALVATIEVLFKPREDKSPGVRMSVWVLPVGGAN